MGSDFYVSGAKFDFLSEIICPIQNRKTTLPEQKPTSSRKHAKLDFSLSSLPGG
jgi:hypothetical protein